MFHDDVLVEDEATRYLASVLYEDEAAYFAAKDYLRFLVSINWQCDDDAKIITVIVNHTEYNSQDSVRTAFAELLNVVDALSIKVNNFIDVL